MEGLHGYAASERGHANNVSPRDEMSIRRLGVTDCMATWRAMQNFTVQRTAETLDELWVTEHLPVYTLGQAGKPEHLLHDRGIPLINIDRGGQITYHGPGQVVVYVLLNLARRGLKVRELVSLVEQSIIDVLRDYDVCAERLAGAPGVYVDGAKIAALGLRIKNGCSYHGLALNVDMDLAPFADINPCGYAGMPVTQLKDLGIHVNAHQAGEALAQRLTEKIERQSL